MAKFHPLEGYYRHRGEDPSRAYQLARGDVAFIYASVVKIIMMGIFLLQFVLIMTPLREPIYTNDGMTTISRFGYGLAIGAVFSLFFVIKARSAVLWVLYAIMCGLVAALALL